VTGTASHTGSWRELLGRYFPTSGLLAGGVGLYATNEFLTVSLLPSTIEDIGGEPLYAWVTTLYLIGSVVSATTVSSMLQRIGARSSYLLGLATFGVACLVCAAAPTMQILIAGRALQGAAGGLLAGLGYALINSTLPSSLWTRASALVSAMWGVATLVGPALGGLFAQFSSWRWAFAAMAIPVMLMGILVPTALPAGRTETSGGKPAVARVPILSLLLAGAAAIAVSLAQLRQHRWETAVLLAASVLLAGIFVVVDWRMRAAVLPPSVFGRGPLKWIYLTIAVQMFATMVDPYVPLFGQRLGNLHPAAAGFLGAVLAVGWTLAELISASLRNPRVVGRVVACSPLVMALGLALGAVTQRDNAPIGFVALWVVGLVLAGTGMGLSWPHLSMRAMDSVDDPAESRAAAAAINTVQLISAAFGAGIAGVVVNAAADDATAARWLYAAFAVVAALGVIASCNATRGDRRSSR